MSHDRRDFLARVATGAVAGVLPFTPDVLRGLEAERPGGPSEWDLSWVDRIKGKYRAVFDVPEIEGGHGVWRASMWGKQCQGVLGAQPDDVSAVIVLRHKAIVLAMQQAFWDRYELGKRNGMRDPDTRKPTNRNPVLSAAGGGTPAKRDDAALDRFIARGGIVLGCDLAFGNMVDLVAKKEHVPPDEARKQALAALVPGVILQPSGVFAALHAQDAGCRYLRAS